MLLGLMLGKGGISVTIVEQTSELDKKPRATHYAPPAMHVLNRAGLGDDMRKLGFLPDGVAWRKSDGAYIAGLSNEVNGDDPDRMVALPLCDLAQLIYDHSVDVAAITYLFHHRVTGIGQDSTRAWVDVENGQTREKTQLFADYIVGCDGANSIVRRSLFGDSIFPGMTWDEQIVATNVGIPIPRPLSMISGAKKSISGLLRLQAVWLQRFELHTRLQRLVHGSENYQGRFMACHIWRHHWLGGRRDHQATA